VRELKRVKRERAEREKAAKESKELERRRNLTDEQRKKEDEDFAKLRSDYGQDKEQWKFLQKYDLLSPHPNRNPNPYPNPKPQP
jgi:microfibrillar-associated protein 1|tara:strand:+ start:77 stop:328 length:252 start_codon:yes stop_codon:yes gene_type:complete